MIKSSENAKLYVQRAQLSTCEPPYNVIVFRLSPTRAQWLITASQSTWQNQSIVDVCMETYAQLGRCVVEACITQLRYRVDTSRWLWQQWSRLCFLPYRSQPNNGKSCKWNARQRTEEELIVQRPQSRVYCGINSQPVSSIHKYVVLYAGECVVSTEGVLVSQVISAWLYVDAFLSGGSESRDKTEVISSSEATGCTECVWKYAVTSSYANTNAPV